MKLFCVVLVVYVFSLTLFGVDGRGGGSTKGLEESMSQFVRARRHAHVSKRGLENGSGYVNNEASLPPHFRERRNAMSHDPPQVNNEHPTPHFRERRNAMNNDPPHVNNEEAPQHFRQRRQLPPPPPGGIPPPPEGLPPPPEGLPAPPA